MGDTTALAYDRETDSLGFAPAAALPQGATALITAHADHWCLTNLHAEDTCFVENMEGGGEFVKVAPRRRDLPIPFELARLVLPVARGAGLVDIFGPEPRYLAADAASRSGTSWPQLDEGAAYFRVLVALCEPQLRGCPPGAVPTLADVIARIRDGEPVMSRAAVNHHINYLATQKLRVGTWAGGNGKRSYWKREAIVAMALRSGLVDEHHLALLPRRRRLSSPPAPDLSSGPARRCPPDR
ncbi:hypothetical protein [Streptomyces sp. NPDC059009]|uniref:hypothetical protein n=1 Tax=Streptomyces sp. NPDC059009 TaxID=3346694 RepID=UPI0036A6493B